MGPFPIALAAAAVVAPATASEKGVPAATPTGEAVNCIQLNQVRQTHVRSDAVIDFYTRSNKVYRNTLPVACPELGFQQHFLHVGRGTDRYCSSDSITVIDMSHTPGVTCGLGKFQEVKLADAK